MCIYVREYGTRAWCGCGKELPPSFSTACHDCAPARALLSLTARTLLRLAWCAVCLAGVWAGIGAAKAAAHWWVGVPMMLGTIGWAVWLWLPPPWVTRKEATP